MNIFKEIYRSMELSFGSPIKPEALFVGNAVDLLKPSTIAKLDLTPQDNDLLLFVLEIQDGMATVSARVLTKNYFTEPISTSVRTKVFKVSVSRLEMDYIDGRINKASKSEAQDFILGGL